jgi:hypothetical protein
MEFQSFGSVIGTTPHDSGLTLTVIGENEFSLPSEAINLGLTGFDPDFGLDIRGTKPLDTTYLVEKAQARARAYGFDFDPDNVRKDINSISAEVGDDEIDVSDDIIYTSLLSVFHEEMGMKVSEEDTSITKRYGNFTEDLIILPDSYYQTYHNARNRSDFRDMSYIDICKIRLAIDIRPMRMGHSGTNDGKASMVGRRQAWIPPGPLRTRYDVFSLFQDIHLGLHRDRKFAYLPESLGGYGKRPPFECRGNIERFIKAYRQGTHARLVRAIVRRTTNWYSKFRDGENPPPDALLAFVSRFTSGFHDWVKGNSIYAPVTWCDVPPEVAKYRVNLSTRVPLQRDVISRLLAEDYLVTESQVQIVHEHNQFCQELLGSRNVLEVREQMTAKRREWLSHTSIFSMEAYGYIKEITIDNEGFQPLIDLEAAAFLKVIDDQSLFNLKLQLRDEPVYDRRVLDDLYSKGPMKVGFRMYPRYLGHILHASQNLYENVVDTEEIGQAEAIYRWLQNGAINAPPRQFINDDNAIIEEINNSPSQYHVVITDDKSLCRLANKKTGKPIFRVPVEWYVRFTYFGDPGKEPWMQYIESRTGVQWEGHLDDGSFRSFEEQMFYNGMPLKKKARQRFSLLKPERHSTRILVEEADFLDPESPPDERPETFIYDKMNILRLQRSKQRA